MKYTSIVLNIILLIAVSVLYYLHFVSHTPSVAQAANATNKITSANSPKIAYFEMDSLENQYGYIKEIRNELKNKQIDMNAELTKLRKNYQSRIAQLQEKASTMSQTEGEAAQREVAQMQQNVAAKEQSLNQSFQEETYKKMQTVSKQIEDFLKQYNKEKGYAYIITSQPGLIYYKDPTYNVTKDLVDGLNAQYKQEAKSKK